jgi:Protein of unknown function (DUF3375)
VTTRDALLLAHGEASNALETPAVRFLARKQAAFVVAVFRTAFGPEVSQIQTHVLHLLVEQAQSELAAEGLEVPAGSGRDVCVEDGCATSGCGGSLPATTQRYT